MPLTATPDHVAVAVPSIDDSLARWRDALGGTVQWRFHNPAVFRGAAVQFAGGAFLELLEPSDAPERVSSLGGPPDFLSAFLDRFGARIHHVTLKVPDLHEAIAEVGRHGLDAVDVDDGDPSWQEAFLRPSQVGGMIVQLAATDRDVAAEAADNGAVLSPVPDSGGRLLGPRLGAPDLDAAASVWATLGGTVERSDQRITVGWGDAPLTVEIVEAGRAGPIGLRFAGTSPRPPDDVLGAAVLAAP